MKIKICCLLLVCSIIKSGFGQATATAIVSASITEPVSIAKKSDLAFFSEAEPRAAGLAFHGITGTRPNTNNTVPSIKKNFKEMAAFEITGDEADCFTITVSSPAFDLIGPVAGKKIAATSFKANIQTGNSPISGNFPVAVEGSFIIPYNAVAGNYSNVGDFSIAVNYN